MLSTGLFTNITTSLIVVGSMNKFGVCFKTITSIGLNTSLEMTTGDGTKAMFYGRKIADVPASPCDCPA
jgi:hypothetical protein